MDGSERTEVGLGNTSKPHLFICINRYFWFLGPLVYKVTRLLNTVSIKPYSLNIPVLLLFTEKILTLFGNSFTILGNLVTK